MFENQQLTAIPRIALGALALAVTLVGAALLYRPPAPSPALPSSLAASPLLARLPDTSDPEIGAEAVLVMRTQGDHAVLFSRNADARFPVASLTKLMTALIFADAVEPLALVDISDAAKRVGDVEEKRSAVPAGERVRAEDLLKLLIVSSDGDAAYAAAEHVGSMDAPANALFQEKIARFVRRMNVRAETLGLTNTHFANPSGIDDPENFSSAADLLRIMSAISERHPEIWAVSRIQELFIFGEKGKRYGVVNTNPLLAEFPAIYGSKTGLEDEAKGALVMLYQLAPDERIAIVLLRSSDRFADGRRLIRWIEESFTFSPPSSTP